MSDWDNFKTRFAQQCIAEKAATSEIKHTPLEAELLEALEQLVRPYGVADVGMANAPSLLQMEFVAVVRKAKDAIAKATGAA